MGKGNEYDDESEIPEDMDGDGDPAGNDYYEEESYPDSTSNSSISKELEYMKKRLKEIEDEAGALREMVADSSSTSATQAEKEEVNSRSIFVGSSYYLEFVEVEALQKALLLNESQLHGRHLKVSAKRTNVPGMKRYRVRAPSRSGSRPGVPFFPPPYGRVPRFRRTMRFRPY